MTEIKNREQVIAKFTEMLMQFDKDCNKYQTDVYMYIDDDGNASLDTFVNVGGNSWLDDDGYVIYRDKEHYDGALDWYTEISEFADMLGITEEQLKNEASVYHYQTEEFADDITWHEVEVYITDKAEYYETLVDAYYDYINDNAADYEQRAEEIFDEFIAQQEEMERWEREEL